MADLRKLKDRAAELAAKGKLEKAADLYRQVSDADPGDTATLQKLAEVLRRAGRTDEAIEAYQAVAERYARDGLLIKSIAISKAILELDPEHVATQAALAELYARRAKAREARPPVRPGTAAPARHGGPARPDAIALPPPEPEDEVVSLPLARPAAAEPVELPPDEGLPFELVPEVEVAVPPAPAPRRGEPQTGFARIVLAAGVPAAGDGEVIDSEALEEGVEVEVAVDEPAAGHAPEVPSTPAPPARGEPAAPALPRVPIFSDLSRDAFVALTRAMALRRVNEGELVLAEGEGGTSFYVVATGKLAVSKRAEQGGAVVLARLGEGDFFGEMALLSGAPRAATVIAEEPCELLEFRADDLLAIAGQHPQLATSLRRFYRQRLLANAMAVSPLFRPFSKGDRKLIMERFRAREVTEGEVIVREGEPSDGMYVVLDGAVEVMKRREGAAVPVGRLREGDLFGEMSCLRKAPASATVIVQRAGTLLRLPRKEFDALVLTYPQILELVSELTDERAESLDAILSGHAEWTEDGLVLV